MYTHTYIHMYTYIYICAHLYAFIYIYISVYMWTYIHMYMKMHIKMTGYHIINIYMGALNCVMFIKILCFNKINIIISIFIYVFLLKSISTSKA